jgi:hypothetical protein
MKRFFVTVVAVLGVLIAAVGAERGFVRVLDSIFELALQNPFDVNSTVMVTQNGYFARTNTWAGTNGTTRIASVTPGYSWDLLLPVGSGFGSGGETNLAQSVGAGAAVYKNKINETFYFKSIGASNNITLESTGDTIWISASGGGGGEVLSFYNTGGSLPNSAGIFKQKAASNVELRKILGDQNINVSQSSDVVGLSISKLFDADADTGVRVDVVSDSDIVNIENAGIVEYQFKGDELEVRDASIELREGDLIMKDKDTGFYYKLQIRSGILTIDPV